MSLIANFLNVTLCGVLIFLAVIPLWVIHALRSDYWRQKRVWNRGVCAVTDQLWEYKGTDIAGNRIYSGGKGCYAVIAWKGIDGFRD